MGRTILRFILLFVVPIGALGVGAHYWVKSARYVTTDNAYIKAHHIAVSADINGRAIRVLAKENDQVQKGDLLFELDPEQYKIDVAKAEAELNGIINKLEALRAEYRTAKAQRKEARQEIRNYKRVFERLRKLKQRGHVSVARYDEAEHDLARARQAVGTIDQKIQQVLAKLGGRVSTPAEKHPMYIEALSRKQQVILNLRRTKVIAPARGIVGKVTLQAGEYVHKGKAVIPIVKSGEIWIEANLKETQLTHIKTGQNATVVVDAYPSRKWDGKVVSISPSTGAELSILPPQNASGNWVKVVQRVPVRLELDNAEKATLLRAGMTVRVSVDTRREQSLMGVIKAAITDLVGK